MKHKHGEVGIGTLILLVALLLVAAITGTVLMQTQGGVQEKSLAAGDQSKEQISIHAVVIDLYATNGTNKSLNYFTASMKLSSGSEPLKLSQAVMTFDHGNKTSILKYAGPNATTRNDATGYYTYRTTEAENVTGGPNSWTIPIVDFDLDQRSETVTGGANLSNVSLNLSSGTNIKLGYCLTGTWTSSVVANAYVQSASGSCGAVGTANENYSSSVFITRKDTNISMGVYSVEFMQTSALHVPGTIQKGDIVRLYFESPDPIGEDQSIRIIFIPKIGTQTLINIQTPEVISRERILLFP